MGFGDITIPVAPEEWNHKLCRLGYTKPFLLIDNEETITIFMGPVAQRLELRTFNPGVVGSNPTRPSIELSFRMSTLSHSPVALTVSPVVYQFTLSAADTFLSRYQRKHPLSDFT